MKAHPDKKDRQNSLLYFLTVLILVLGLSILVYLERRVVSDRRASIDNARDLIGKERILKAGDDIRISFSTIESLAGSIKKNPYINDLYVSKIIARRGEHVVYPFFFNALPENRRPELARLTREPLTEGDITLGYLYIKLNNRIITGVRAAVAFFVVLLLLTLFSFYSRVYAQQRVISKTTIELREKRDEMIRLERLALAGQLSANILHDLKKPVLNIKQEAQDYGEVSREKAALESTKNILEQVDLFFGILRELGLERFVKARQGGEEYVDVNEMLRRSLRLVRYERGGVRLSEDLEEGLPLLLAHPYKIIQLFSNLILNAYQAMKGQGTLSLKSSARGERIRIEIADTGPGIPPEIAGKLFTPFFTTRQEGDGEGEGTGLGLYISRNIVEELGGKIRLESEPGKGARFHVEFPAGEKQ